MNTSSSQRNKRRSPQVSESEPAKKVKAAIDIIKPIEKSHSFRVNCDELEKILSQEKLLDKKVCLIGIAGKFRKGKSFMLNFFLQYLTHITENEINSSQNWCLKNNKPSSGFTWKGGSENHTTGICLWHKPFVVKDNDEDLVILLMDTQGTFSNENLKNTTTIFALSTMISSVQIYNLQNNIHQDDLDSLQYFVEYGKMVLDDNNVNPFQSLVFLVRDWSSPNEYQWGFNGGEKFLTKRLTSTNDQQDGKKSGIQNSFKKIGCFLMPHPGEKVAENSAHFRGQPSEWLLPKEINGNPVTCRQLIKQIKKYTEIFNSDEVPETKSLFNLMVRTTHEEAFETARDTYEQYMQRNYVGNAFMLAFRLNQLHREAQNESHRAFNKFRKMGGANCKEDYLNKLEKFIKNANDERFNHRKLLATMAALGSPLAVCGVVALVAIALVISGPARVIAVVATLLIVIFLKKA